MLRGINRQVIFEEDADRRFFISVLGECKKISGFKLHAFCLMVNHVHLLIEPADEPLDIIFKRIGASYVNWYNRKYERVGHLFQNRFRSENVETKQYYMTVLRYILQNPLKAGMENHLGTYRWSSYLAYEKGGGSLTDTGFSEKLFGSRETMMAFLRETNEDEAMAEVDYQWRLSDEDALKLIRKITDCASVSKFQQLDLDTKKEYARKMYLEKMSINQISRLTGMSRTTLQRTMKKITPKLLNDRQSLNLRESDATDYAIMDEIW